MGSPRIERTHGRGDASPGEDSIFEVLGRCPRHGVGDGDDIVRGSQRAQQRGSVPRVVGMGTQPPVIGAPEA
jgi:hypothetical protein